jgi:hypothetical protein
MFAEIDGGVVGHDDVELSDGPCSLIVQRQISNSQLES